MEQKSFLKKETSPVELDPAMPFDEKWRVWCNACLKSHHLSIRKKIDLYKELIEIRKLLDVWFNDNWDVGIDIESGISMFTQIPYLIWRYENIKVYDNNGNHILMHDMFVKMTVRNRQVFFNRRGYFYDQYSSSYFHSHISKATDSDYWSSEICYGDANGDVCRNRTRLRFHHYLSFYLPFLQNFLSNESTTTNPYKTLYDLDNQIGEYNPVNPEKFFPLLLENVDKLNVSVMKEYGVFTVNLVQDESLIEVLKQDERIYAYQVGDGVYTKLFDEGNVEVKTSQSVISIRDKEYPLTIYPVDTKNLDKLKVVNLGLVSSIVSTVNRAINNHVKIKQDYSSDHDSRVLEQDKVSV